MLGNLTSDHSILNITCDVGLSSVIKLTNLTNITITGHNKPTIDCNNNGGLHLTSCRNFKFDSIIWKQNGSSLNNSFILNFSSVTFKRHSEVIFKEIALGNHFVLYNHSNLTFEDDSIAIFGVISSHAHSSVTFKGNSTVAFTGIGSIQSEHYSNTIFDDNSTVSFTINSSKVIYSLNHCNVTFKGNSKVIFRNEIYGSGIYSEHYGSGIYSEHYGSVIYSEHYGSVINSEHYGNVIFDENSYVLFSFNRLYRGAIHSEHYSNIMYKGNSTAEFFNNTALYGGAIYSYNHSSVTFEENTNVSFIHNEADQGGALFSMSDCSIAFKGYSLITFEDNMARIAGALRSYSNSTTVFDENTTVAFIHNVVTASGGALDLYHNADVVFKGNADVIFNNNIASTLGGACVCYSDVRFIDNATVSFVNNKADKGGGLYIANNYNVTFEKAQVTFSSNKAAVGAAIWMNVAVRGGKVNFIMQGVGRINFDNNTSEHGNSIFVDISVHNKSYFLEQLLGITSCNISYLDEQQDGLKQHFTTPPSGIILQDIKEKPLICDDDVTCDCKSYYLNNVMLGLEISLKGMVYDYLDNRVPLETPTYDYLYNLGTEFQIYEQNTNYSIKSVNPDSSQGLDFMVTGNKITSNYNFSVEVTSYLHFTYALLTIQLIIQLSP